MGGASRRSDARLVMGLRTLSQPSSSRWCGFCLQITDFVTGFVLRFVCPIAVVMLLEFGCVGFPGPSDS
jgi:hypothetical protein